MTAPHEHATLNRIRGEYREMPGLKLTIPQAARLWNEQPEAIERLLDTLVADGMLRRIRRGTFFVLAA